MDRVLVIAEAGVNHNGDLHLAKELAWKAKECGADMVKYQTFDLNQLVSENAPMASYQENNVSQTKTQKEMLEKLALSYNDFKDLKAYCDKIGIAFLSTAFDIKSVDFLESVDIPFWKIPSGEITNYPYLVRIAKTGKPIILSTGMSTLEEIDACVALLKNNGAGELTILQCNTQYPTEYADANVRAMLTLKERYGTKVGYSDHTRGTLIPIMAVSLGASVIEKHFTLDTSMEGPDHKASLNPQELAEMVQAIRDAEIALGSGEKKPSVSEMQNAPVARKSIVAACHIGKGQVFTERNVTTKRPGNGISPMKWDSVIGTKAIKDFEEDDLIEI